MKQDILKKIRSWCPQPSKQTSKIPWGRVSITILISATILTASFSLLAPTFLFKSAPSPLIFKDPFGEYNSNLQNLSAIAQGSELIITFNYINDGARLTLERFYISGSYGAPYSFSDDPPQQNIPGLVITFNGTVISKAEDLQFVLQPHDLVATSITIPNYKQQVVGTYVVLNVVEKGIIWGPIGIPIQQELK